MADIATKATRHVVTMQTVNAGPPFRAPFSRFKNLTGHGFWCAAGYDDQRGTLNLQMGRQADGPQPLRIGYGSAGWVLKRHFRSAPHLRASITATDFIVQPNGGVMVPWAFLNVKGPNGLDIFENRRIYPGQTLVLSANGNRAGHYEVFYGVYLRGAYQGAASPYGELFARIVALALTPYAPQRTARGDGAEALGGEALDAEAREAVEALIGSRDHAEIEAIG